MPLNPRLQPSDRQVRGLTQVVASLCRWYAQDPSTHLNVPASDRTYLQPVLDELDAESDGPEAPERLSVAYARYVEVQLIRLSGTFASSDEDWDVVPA